MLQINLQRSAGKLFCFWKINNKYGRVPERPKGADCKSVIDDFGGSNPPSPTTTVSQTWYNRKGLKSSLFCVFGFFSFGRFWLFFIFALKKITPPLKKLPPCLIAKMYYPPCVLPKFQRKRSLSAPARRWGRRQLVMPVGSLFWMPVILMLSPSPSVGSVCIVKRRPSVVSAVNTKFPVWFRVLSPSRFFKPSPSFAAVLPTNLVKVFVMFFCPFRFVFFVGFVTLIMPQKASNSKRFSRNILHENVPNFRR